MAYTPINWQTGDTITAEKLNKMDNGWEVESTQLFSETVTTEAGPMGNSAPLSYAGTDAPDSMNITFDGVDYICAQQTEDGKYWWGAPDPSGFSTYPFVVLFMDDSWLLITETAGTHTVAAGTSTLAISTAFQDAVNACVGALPMRCVVGETLRSEMNAARNAGRMMYIIHSGISYFVSRFFDNVASVTVTPTPTGINFEFDSNDILTYGES